MKNGAGASTAEGWKSEKCAERKRKLVVHRAVAQKSELQIPGPAFVVHATLLQLHLDHQHFIALQIAYQHLVIDYTVLCECCRIIFVMFATHFENYAESKCTKSTRNDDWM